jgi:hypothetical protein
MHSAIVFVALFATAFAGGLPGIPTPFGQITGVADTPEVQLAKAQHFAAHAAARGIVAPVAVAHHGYAAHAIAAPVIGYPYAARHLGGIPTPFGQITGVADTPEVNAAKAQHFAAHAAARSGLPSGGIPTLGGVITGVAETPEVVAAKAQHFAAHAVARGAAIVPVAHSAVAVAHHGLGYAAGFASPVISQYHGGHLAGIPTAHGVITGVADTPEVMAAKAQHFALYNAELARHG